MCDETYKCIDEIDLTYRTKLILIENKIKMVNEKIIPGYNISMEEFSAICLEIYNTKCTF